MRRGWERACSVSEGPGLLGCMWCWWHLTSFMGFELVKLVYPSRGTLVCFACVASRETAEAVETMSV